METRNVFSWNAIEWSSHNRVWKRQEQWQQCRELHHQVNHECHVMLCQNTPNFPKSSRFYFFGYFLSHWQPLWATSEKWKLGYFWANFRQCLAPWFQKYLATQLLLARKWSGCLTSWRRHWFQRRSERQMTDFAGDQYVTWWGLANELPHSDGWLMPDTHRRHRRDSTVELNRVGGVKLWTHPSAVVTQFTISCTVEPVTVRLLRLVTNDDVTTSLLKKLSMWTKIHRPNPSESSWLVSYVRILFTPPTRRNLTVESRRHRRCVLGFRWLFISLPTTIMQSAGCRR